MEQEDHTNGHETEPVEMPAVLDSQIRGEFDVQIATAKRYPRNIGAFKRQAMDMATLDEETASGCFYSLPRGGKPIEGPSARLAEIVLSAWGNVRAETKVVDVGDKEITSESTTWDLEKNVAIRIQVKRRITEKNGRRYSDDMIVVTGNAACSIALRNSVFKVIPMVYTKAIYHAARQVAIGDVKTLAAKRAEMIQYFGKMGVQQERVFAVVGKKNIEDVGLEELATLKGLATAIKEGDTSVDEAFPLDASGNPLENLKGSKGLDNLAERMKQNNAPTQEAKQAEQTPSSQTQTDSKPADTTQESKPAADKPKGKIKF